MAINGQHPIRSRQSNGISGWVLFFVTIFTILACSGASWALTSTLAAPKSEYASNINDINNSIDHLQDSANNLNSFMSYETASNQTKIDDVENDILGIDANLAATETKITGVNTAINATNNRVSTVSASVSSLTTTVDSIGSIQIVPTLTPIQRTLSDGSFVIDSGSIDLAIHSTQTVDSMTLAFKVEFTPSEETGAIADTFDKTLQDLYALNPIQLNPGGPSGVAVTPDHISYNVYYKIDGYHLGGITFTTQGTAVTKDTTSKTLSYTFNAASGYSFNVTVTPIFECTSTTINTLAPVW